MVLRLQTYAKASGLTLQPTTQQYCQMMINNPHMDTWIKTALKETRIITEDETGEIISLAGVLAN
ncbi:hypothetical protein Psyaliredsea_28150 [Psychrobacter alimentarius]